MTKGPAKQGDYPDRWLDCQHALEPLFMELVEASLTPFIDLSHMAGPIFQAGEEAGWTVDDIASAIAELAVNYQLGESANRTTDAAIAKAMTTVRKQ
jgi:hypothetical protein